MKRMWVMGVMALMFMALYPARESADPVILEVGKGKPYSTIGAAVAAASPGDKIRVYPGVYREFVVIDKPLTLEAAQGQPVIENIYPDPTEPARYDGAIRVRASNVTVRGFLLISDGDVVSVNPDPSPDPLTNVLIEDNHVKGVETWATHPEGYDPNHRPGIFACNVSYLTVRNNIVQNTTGMGIFLGLIWSGTDVRDSLIEGNLVVDSEYTGVGMVRGSRNTIKGNKVMSAGVPEHNLDDGVRLGVGATSNTVEYNHVSGCNRDGIRAVPAASGNLIQYNKSVGNARYDINDDGPSPTDNTWYGNQFNTQGGSATG